jgi:hypothetical protein
MSMQSFFPDSIVRTTPGFSTPRLIYLMQDTRHTNKDKAAVRPWRHDFIWDLTWSRFIALLWNPKALYKDPRNINGSTTNVIPGQGEEEIDGMLRPNPSLTATSSRLPLPFNLEFTRPTRPSRTGNAVPGALLRDW